MVYRREWQWVVVVLFVVALLGIAGCGLSASAEQRGLPDRDPELAYRLVTQEHGILLDVRTPAEYKAGHLPSAKNIPVQELSARLGDVKALAGGDKSHPIVVYCLSGARAARAKRILLDAGYTRVTNLGGFDDWPAH